jgi:hypothetical protein
MNRACLIVIGFKHLNLSQAVFFSQNFLKENKKLCTSSFAEGMELSAVVKSLQSFAPKSLAESWDNVGLLVNNFVSLPTGFCRGFN